MYHMCGFMALRCSKSATLARLAMLQATVWVWLYTVRKCLFMYFFLLVSIFMSPLPSVNTLSLNPVRVNCIIKYSCKIINKESRS